MFHPLTRSFSSGESLNHLSLAFASAGFPSDLASAGDLGFCSSGARPAPALVSAKEQRPCEPLPYSIRGGAEGVGG